MSSSNPTPLVRQCVRELIACLIAQADPVSPTRARGASATPQPPRRRRRGASTGAARAREQT